MLGKVVKDFEMGKKGYWVSYLVSLWIIFAFHCL